MLGLCSEQIDLEPDEVAAVLRQPIHERLAPQPLGERIRILAFRKHGHLDIQPFTQDDVHPPDGGTQPCRVPVEEHGHALAETPQEPDLLDGQGRSRTGHDMLHAGLAHGHDIGIAFHKDGAVLANDGVPRHVDAIEGPGLVVQRTLRAVDVLGNFLVLFKGPAPEADEPARDIPDGENHPAAVEIIQRAIFPLLAQPAGQQPLLLVACLLGRRRKGAFFRPRTLRTVAQREILQDRVREITAPEVADAHTLALSGLPQLLGEPLLGPTRQVRKALALGLLLQLLGRQLPLLDLDAVLARQPAKGFRIGELFVLHEERHGASALARAEILEDALSGHHIE